MRKILLRLLAASVATVIFLVPAAGANWPYGVRETVFVEPTSSTVYVPSSYSEVIPSSYVTTSATLLPASYAYTTTSYSPVTTSYYVPTYYSRGLFGRRLARRAIYETAAVYSPTSYYLPTTVQTIPTTVAATSYRGPCQESAVAFNPPPTMPTETSKAITSTPVKAEPAYIPRVKQKDPAVETAKQKMPEVAEEPKAMADIQPSPPPPPAPEKKEEPKDPIAPLPNPVDDPKPTERQSMKPAPTEMRPRDGVASQNVLRGEVVSGVNGKPVTAAEVIFSNPNGRFKERTQKTDAKGAFEVFLPEGDWMVTIRDPSAGQAAQAKVVGQVTSTSGKYLDDNDKPIYSLKIWN